MDIEDRRGSSAGKSSDRNVTTPAISINEISLLSFIRNIILNSLIANDAMEAAEQIFEPVRTIKPTVQVTWLGIS